MVVTVFVSRVPGNSEIRRKQEFVTSVLKGKKIQFDEIDISDVAHEEDKKFMLDHSKPSGNAKTPSAPQIFNDGVYCGDYEGFHEANENDDLKTFLKL